MTTRQKWVVAGTFLAAALVGAGLGLMDRPGHVYKITEQHNAYEVGITCTNGGDPTVAGSYDGMLIVSCGASPSP